MNGLNYFLLQLKDYMIDTFMLLAGGESMRIGGPITARVRVGFLNILSNYSSTKHPS